jgi:hypothetical protein
VAILGLSVGSLFLRVCTHILIAMSLGLLTPGNVGYFFVFVPATAILTTLPLPFGVREAMTGALFSVAKFPPDAAIVMGFIASLVAILASLPGGIFTITGKVTLRKKKTDAPGDRVVERSTPA